MKKIATFVFYICLVWTIQAQPFERTFNGTGGLSLTKEGNLLRIETCEDSSRVDLIVDQQGILQRTERYFKGSCRNINIGFKQQLADGNYLLLTDTLMRKVRRDGSLIFSRAFPAESNEFVVRPNGSFVKIIRKYRAAQTSYIASLANFDSLGNETWRRIIADSVPYTAHIKVYLNNNGYHIQEVDISEVTNYIKRFDNEGNLLWSRNFFVTYIKTVTFNHNQTKLLFSDGTYSFPLAFNFLDNLTGEGYQTIINERFLAFRTKAFLLDSLDNFFLIASGSEPGSSKCCSATTEGYLSIRKFSKDGVMVFGKDFYPNAPIQPTALAIVDDGSIFVTGNKSGKTWLIKLNCVGEVVPSIPLRMCISIGEFWATPLAWIRKMSLNSVINETRDSFSTNILNYSSFANVLTTLQREQTYPLSITAKTDSTQGLDSLSAKAWFDFNRNGEFDTDEMIALTRHDSTFTTTVNVPNNAKTGTIAMRLRVNFKQQIQGCDYDVKGEIEDYAITIEGATTPCDNDNQAPTLLCPNNIVVTDSSQIGNWQTPIFSDNCEKTADIVLESNFVKGSKFPLGTSRVIYTATDRLCNATNCSFNVTVNSIINAANERPSFPIRVFPNPTVGAVFIEFESPQIQTVSFRFSNTIGQTVFSETRLIERGINRLQFDVSKLRQGVYFCTISDNKLILSIGKLFVAN